MTELVEFKEKVNLCIQIPADLDARFRARASKNRRSLTGELTLILEEALPAEVARQADQPAQTCDSH